MATTSFDIGPSDGLAIFTNNSEDIFNSGFDEPSFQIDSGPTQGVADIGNVTNVSEGITVDFSDNAPVKFETPSKPPPSKPVQQPVQQPVKTGFDKPPPRQKAESIVSEKSFSSDKTVEAEPVSRGFRPHKSSSFKPIKNRFNSEETTSKPEPIVYNKTPKEFKPNRVKEIGSDEKEINFGFDELLDSSKLKPLKEDVSPPSNPMPEPIPVQDNFSSFSGSPEPLKPSGFGSSTPMPETPKSTYAPVYNTPEPPKAFSFSDIPKYANDDEEKLDLLLKLKSLQDRKGVTLSKHFGAKSSLDELRLEYKHQTNNLERDASVKMMRNGLIFATSGLEYVNRRFDPVGAKLDGWGESVMENIMDYDGIFERLHEKYQGSVEMEPEMELLFALAGSAFMFHLSKTLFNSAVPQFDSVLRERPGLVQEIFGAATEAARRQQATEKQNQQYQQSGPMPANAVPQQPMQPPPVDLSSLLGQVMGGLGGLGGLATDPLPRPVDTQKIPDPPMNEIYRQMVQKENDVLSVTSHESNLGNRATIMESPKGERVIRI